MHISNQFIINKNPLLKKYLRENSYYYKFLNRNPEVIKDIYVNMQKTYKLTINDKLDKMKDNLSMINGFMDILN